MQQIEFHIEKTRILTYQQRFDEAEAVLRIANRLARESGCRRFDDEVRTIESNIKAKKRGP
jgi:hypothetical protein